MRYIITGIFILLLTVVQTTILRGIEIMGVIPNLLIVAVICYALLNQTRPGLVFGLICGVVLDCIGGRLIGVNTLLCLYMSYLCGLTSERLFNNNIFVAILFVVALSLLYEAISYLLNYLIWGDTAFVFAIFGKIIPASVYNGLLTFVVYPIVARLSPRREGGIL